MRGIPSLLLMAIICKQANAFSILSPGRTNQVKFPILSAPPKQSQQRSARPFSNKKCILFAGGFEWEDPADAFDQGVENPFENPELNLLIDSTEKSVDNAAGEDGEPLKIDPARLLGPRLNGSNLYFVGMMGSGKSAVGDVVARSK